MRGARERKRVHFLAKQFEADDLISSSELRLIVNGMSDPFGVVMLNSHALDITLNWLCNTKHMRDVHNRTLFFTLDEVARRGLIEFYPTLRIFRWNAPCLKVIHVKSISQLSA
uniref:Uncharacterized protein n=1 Tax=Parascaris univalens TaxID=6257 RepID=A0A915BFC0_PARUN